MRTRRWIPGGFAARLALITLGGFVLRLAYVLALRTEVIGGDGWSYHYGAMVLAEGRGFVDTLPWGDGTHPDAHHPPLWTLLLAIPSLLGCRSWLGHQFFACLLGAATVPMTGSAGRRIAGARAGLCAASIAALYPGLWVYERQLLGETLALFLVAGLILLAYRFLARPNAPGAAALGAACGLLALTRPEQALLAVVLVAPLVLLAKVRLRQRVAWLALAAATTAGVLLPWTLYNLPRFERPVLLTTSLGGGMASANCDLAYSGPLLGFYDGRFVVKHPSLLGLPPAADASVANARRIRAALDYIAAHRGRLPLVLLAREGRAWSFFRPFQQTRFDSEWRKTRLWVDRLGLFAYWTLLPAAACGIVVLRRRRIPLYPLLAFVVTCSIAVALTYGETRYRASAEVSIVLLAAIGVDALLRAARKAKRAKSGSRPFTAGGPRAGLPAGPPVPGSDT